MAAVPNSNLRNKLKPVLKEASVNTSKAVTTTFRTAIQEHLRNGQKNNYPVNYESRYNFKYVNENGVKSNSFTAGNFDNNRKLLVNGSAAPTQAPNITKLKGYNNDKVLQDILKPLVKTYAPTQYRNGANLNKKYNYSIVMRSRKSKINEISWHTNAVNHQLGTPVWQIIYYVDTPKVIDNGSYKNANVEHRGKLRFVITPYGTTKLSKPIVGELIPQKNIGIGAIPDYFYHSVSASNSKNKQNVTRQIIVVMIHDPNAKLKTNVPGEQIYTPEIRNHLNGLHKGTSKSNLFGLVKFNQNLIKKLTTIAKKSNNNATSMNINNNNATNMNINNPPVNLITRLLSNIRLLNSMNINTPPPKETATRLPKGSVLRTATGGIRKRR